MKIARPCPRCGEVTLANKCNCGYEFMPEAPPPKSGKDKKKPKKGKGKGKGKFLSF